MSTEGGWKEGETQTRRWKDLLHHSCNEPAARFAMPYNIQAHATSAVLGHDFDIRHRGGLAVPTAVILRSWLPGFVDRVLGGVGCHSGRK